MDNDYAEHLRLEAALKNRQCLGPLTTGGLRQLVRQGRWADIGKMFNFEPVFSECAGSIYFNWTCCPPEFWAKYQPHKYALGKQGPTKQDISGRPKPAIVQHSKQERGYHPNNEHRTNGLSFPIPRVGSKRYETWHKQAGHCFYCNTLTDQTKWTVDHRKSRANGGKNHHSNYAGCCWSCNHAKKDMNEEEFIASNYLKQKRKLLGH